MAQLIEDCDVFFRNNYKAMMNEANQVLLSRIAKFSRVSEKVITQFEEKLRLTATTFISWLRYESVKVESYSLTLLQDLLFLFIENCKKYFEGFHEISTINEHATRILILSTNFFESLVNLGFEYVLIDTVKKQRGISNIEWFMLQLLSIYNYHFMLGMEGNPEETEKMFEVKIHKIENLSDRGDKLLGFIKDSMCLRKYCNNRVVQCAHSMLRILMAVLQKNNAEYDALLERTRFGFWLASIMQKQYSLLQLYIKTKTENIHLISRYVEESNIRLRLFEAVLKSTSEKLKDELLESLCIQRILSSLMISETEFDVTFYRSNYKFLPFRNFQPFRNEGICLISIIFWNREQVPKIYSELINEMIKSNTLFTEIEHLKQRKNKLTRLSAFAFFSRIISNRDSHVFFLMKQQFMFENIETEMEAQVDLKHVYPDLYNFLTSGSSIC